MVHLLLFGFFFVLTHIPFSAFAAFQCPIANTFITGEKGLGVAFINRAPFYTRRGDYVPVGPTIFLSPVVENLTFEVAQFIHAHECAHHVNKDVIFGSNVERENRADDWAIRELYKLDQVTAKSSDDITKVLSTIPGSWSHAPGSERAKRIENTIRSLWFIGSVGDPVDEENDGDEIESCRNECKEYYEIPYKCESRIKREHRKCNKGCEHLPGFIETLEPFDRHPRGYCESDCDDELEYAEEECKENKEERRECLRECRDS